MWITVGMVITHWECGLLLQLNKFAHWEVDCCWNSDPGECCGIWVQVCSKKIVYTSKLFITSAHVYTENCLHIKPPVCV
jgi:hypothetical protein